MNKEAYLNNRKAGLRGQGPYPSMVVGGMAVAKGSGQRSTWSGLTNAVLTRRLNAKKHSKDRRRNRPIVTVVQHGTIVRADRIEITRGILADGR